MIWVIFECDRHRSHKSYRIIAMSAEDLTAKFSLARMKYIRQDNPDGWILNLATYEPPRWDIDIDGSIYSSLKVIESTGENY